MNGQVRDVYRWNLLNKSHLEFAIEGVPFREWVSQVPGRGVLKPFTGALTLWEVPNTDIPRLQKPLVDAGMIYDYLCGGESGG